MAAIPMLERSDLTDAKGQAQNRLRTAALHAEHVQPLQARLDEAGSLLMQLRGILASAGNTVPAALDQQLFSWLHSDASTRKAEGK